MSRFGEVILDIKSAVGGPNFDAGSPEQWARSNRVKSSADAPFGWIAFSPERMPSEDIPYEPNTPVESDVRDSMLAYANDNTDIEPDKASLIRNLLAGEYYEDAIRYTPRSVKTVYRGMAISDADAERLGPGLQEALFNLEPNEPARTIDYSFVYKPRNPSGLSSWSDDFKVARQFAEQNVLDAIDGSEESAFAFVLQADIADNPEGFLDALHLFRKMGLRNALVNEREHLGLNEIRISRMTALRVNVAGLSDDDEDEENRNGMGYYQLMNTLSQLAPKFSADGRMMLNKQ